MKTPMTWGVALTRNSIPVSILCCVEGLAGSNGAHISWRVRLQTLHTPHHTQTTPSNAQTNTQHGSLHIPPILSEACSGPSGSLQCKTRHVQQENKVCHI